MKWVALVLAALAVATWLLPSVLEAARRTADRYSNCTKGALESLNSSRTLEAPERELERALADLAVLIAAASALALLVGSILDLL